MPIREGTPPGVVGEGWPGDGSVWYGKFDCWGVGAGEP
jgi:hypothetical protein